MPLLQPWSYCAMPVIDVIHRPHSWVALLAFSLLWKLAWHLPLSWKLVFWEVSFFSIPAQEFLNLVSEVHDIFSSRDLPSTSGGNQFQQQYAAYLGSLLDSLTNNSKKGFSCLIIGFLLVILALLLEKASSAQIFLKKSLKFYFYIYIKIIFIIDFNFRQLVNSVIPCSFSRHPHWYFTHLPTSLFTSPLPFVPLSNHLYPAVSPLPSSRLLLYLHPLHRRT